MSPTPPGSRTPTSSACSPRRSPRSRRRARSNQRIYDTFAKVAAQARAEGRDPREAMGEAYADPLEDCRLLLTQTHQHAAAAAMPEVAKESHASFERLVALVQREDSRYAAALHRSRRRPGYR
jgi:hypothetical protein